jgi:hypothetical protein
MHDLRSKEPSQENSTALATSAASQKYAEKPHRHRQRRKETVAGGIPPATFDKKAAKGLKLALQASFVGIL